MFEKKLFLLEKENRCKFKVEEQKVLSDAPPVFLLHFQTNNILLSIIDEYAAIEDEEFVLPMVNSIAVHFIML